METINKIKVFVKNGNVAAEKVDCIVVPEFNSCASYGGVGAAIEAAGMVKGLEAYDQVAQEKPFNYGDVLLTDSGKDGVKLAHVATAGASCEEQFRAVFMAMYEVLILAKGTGIKTIAVPEIGTGIIGTLTQEESARAIFEAVYQFSQRHPESCVKEINLVIFRGSTAPAERVLAEQSYLSYSEERGTKEFSIADWLEGMSGRF